MDTLQKQYFLLLFSHLLLGVVIYEFPVVSKVYAILIIICGVYFTVKNKNADNEVLYAAAYIVGAEVFLRMTHGNPNYEFGKYSVIMFAVIGAFYSGFSKKAYPYFIFLLLLIPGTLITFYSVEDRILQTILFDISGPACLAISAIYCLRREVTITQTNKILLFMGMPIIACCSYLFLHSPITRLTYFNTESSVFLSGNFGPNQVATALGLGMFVFFFKVMFKSFNSSLFILNLTITMMLFYRGIMTFSRGGMLTSVAMIIALLVFFYLYSGKAIREQWRLKIIVVFGSFLTVFLFASYQSDGLLVNRYANEDMRGNFKMRKVTTGRVKLAVSEINNFKENPVFGLGPGMGKINRVKRGKPVASHNEMTRMMGEHGTLGLAALLILIFIPILLYLEQKENIYRIVFFMFWLLTINHSGMRIAAPSFIYALALLHVKWDKKDLLPIQSAN